MFFSLFFFPVVEDVGLGGVFCKVIHGRVSHLGLMRGPMRRPRIGSVQITFIAGLLIRLGIHYAPMDQNWAIMQLVFGVFVIIGAGVMMRRLNWLTAEADVGLLKLLVRVLLPCFFFHVVVGNPRFMTVGQAWQAPAVGFGATALGYGVGVLFAHGFGKYIGLHTRVQRQTFALCVGTFNYGYIPVPLVQKLFDDATLGTLVVHNLGVEIAIWTVGLLVLQGTLSRHCFKRLLNPPLFVIIGAMMINTMRWHEAMPGFLITATTMLAATAIPMGLILTGATLGDYLGKFRFSVHGMTVPAAGTLLRLGLIPACFMAGAYWLPVSVELKRVMVVQASMPAAVFPIILSRHYGGDPRTAIGVILVTSLISIVTIPLVMGWGLGLLGG